MQVGENREREGYALVRDRTGFYSHGSSIGRVQGLLTGCGSYRAGKRKGEKLKSFL